MIKEFYKNKTILVTGHTGFKGSWLSIWLLEMGANVIGYSLDPKTDKDNFVLTGLADKMVDIRGDIRDFEKLSGVFNKYNPEIVFHLAAQPLVRLSYDLPKETFDTNITGAVNVLECFRLNSKSKYLINVTSDKCYENKEQIWGYRESDPLGGHDPYSASKACSEIVTSAYMKSFFYGNTEKNIATGRAGNVIGGGDWALDRIIPDCIRAIENNLTLEVRSPKAVRPWQHVLEALYGYILLGYRLSQDPARFSQSWNFGPNSEMILTVENIVGKIINKYGTGKWLDISDKKTVHEAKLLSLDTTKAKLQLEWHPVLNIDQTVEMTVNWYKEYKHSCVYDLCSEQIKNYTKLLGESDEK